MAATLSFKPPFAPNDYDTVQGDFTLSLVRGETIGSPVVTASGGFTVAPGTAQVGSINVDGQFVMGPGPVVQAFVTASGQVGTYQITFAVTTSNGRTLRRTVTASVAVRS